MVAQLVRSLLTLTLHCWQIRDGVHLFTCNDVQIMQPAGIRCVQRPILHYVTVQTSPLTNSMAKLHAQQNQETQKINMVSGAALVI